MITESYSNLVLVFFDDDTAHPNRDKFLDAIFEANNIHLSNEELAHAREAYNKNRGNTIAKFRVQKSVYCVKMQQSTTYESVVGKFKSFIDLDKDIILSMPGKITASEKVIRKINPSN